jgi:hypothetical protein
MPARSASPAPGCGRPAPLPLAVGAAALLAFLLAAPAARAQSLDLPEKWPPRPIATVDVNLFPILLYTPETRTGGGVGTWLISHGTPESSNGKPSNVWMSAVYTQERQTILRVIPELFFGAGLYRLRLHLRYLDYPTRFFGIGNDTPVSAEELYNSVNRGARVTFTRVVTEPFSAGVVGDFDDMDIVRVEPGRQLDSGQVPGARGSRLGGLGAIALWDAREHHFNPREGGLLELTALRYEALESDEHGFWRGGLDARWYQPVLETHLLRLQGILQSVSGNPPFTALPQLGGKVLLRGLYEGRYRDRNLLAFQAEYRISFGGRWGVTAFAGYGDVAETPRDFSLREFKTAGGLGLRYAWNVRERINIRLDVAGARDSTGVYFSVGEAY